ncbi:L-lactate dehydrogenase, partial [Anaerorhabdus sp.]|uniref:L-lactate dehydrogenase n=1 Tax=Anaerorhabdus sp. TaxID=1872524 RepID=UPI002FCB41CC
MEKNKVVIVGAGMVGMSYAYSMVNQGTCEELVLIDIDKNRTVGEALDLNHGLSYAPRKMKIYSGDYADCNDANIICITAGATQLPGETRLDLLHKNTKIMKSIVGEIKKTNFNGIIIVASNPVDIMTYVVWKASGYDRKKIMGSGTTLDSARLRFGLGERLNVNPKAINAYVMGEHGDSQFVAWSYALLGVQPIYQIASKKDSSISFNDLDLIEDEVRNIAYKIIECKKTTYYGIGMALAKITQA